MEGSLGYGSQLAAQSPAAPGKRDTIESGITRVEELEERVAKLIARAGRLADQVSGSVPSPINTQGRSGAEPPMPPMFVPRLSEGARRAHIGLSTLESEIDRLERGLIG